MTEVQLNETCSVERDDKLSTQEKERRAFDVNKLIMEADWLLRTRQRLHAAKTRRRAEFAELFIVADSIMSVWDGEH